MAEIHSSKIDERKYPTVLLNDLKIEGHLKFSKPVIFKCALKGEVVSSDDVVIDSSAILTANVKARSIRVWGTVHGNMIASENVILENTAKINGNINSPKIQMEPGSLFEGVSHMSSSKSDNNASST